MSNQEDKKKQEELTRRNFLKTTSAIASSLFITQACSTNKKRKVASDAEDTVVDDTIVRAAIHPAIGMARVGNSESEYYLGPEVVDVAPNLNHNIRDAKGALKKEATRFRIYGYNKKGEVVRELNSKEANIEWSVHLANKKSSWYRFYAALDVPNTKELLCPKRNAQGKHNIQGKARNSLNIDAGINFISGNNKKIMCNKGKYKKINVNLGELRTDEFGRLIVLGGSGKAASPSDAEVYEESDVNTFNNANDWYDDISDGPVKARVRISGVEIPVESAWLCVGPPNYAPEIVGWRTMHDLLLETYVKEGMIEHPVQTSFTHDIEPILKRLSNLSWVNKGFNDRYGKGGEFDFSDTNLLAKLSSHSDREDVMRIKSKIFDSFRLDDDSRNRRDRNLWPHFYGDAYGSFDESDHVNFVIKDLRTFHLNNWMNGKFEDDFDANRTMYEKIEDYPIYEQPAMLDKAPLHYCLADAFHPGCELTWPMRHITMYKSPFRIKHRDYKEIELGEYLSQKNVFTENGPLFAQGPGDLTRWMAIPWQGDTVGCRSGYEKNWDPYILTYWPARVPNHVLSEQAYNYVMNENNSREQRLYVYKERSFWHRTLRGDFKTQINQLIKKFEYIGVIEARKGIENDPDFPDIMYVENLPQSMLPPATRKPLKFGTSDQTYPKNMNQEEINILKAGWESVEQFNEFRRVRFGKKDDE